MERDWGELKASRGAAVGERPGRSPTGWFREKVDELRAHSEYLLEQDQYHQLLRSRMGTGVPSHNGAESPWKALKELGFDIQGMVSQERDLRARAEQEADEAKSALYQEQADRLREQIEGLRQEFRDYTEGRGPQGGSDRSGREVSTERPKGFLERLDDFLEGKVMQRFGAFLLGEGQGSGNGQPEDPEEVVLRRLNTGNRLREALGLPPPGAGRAPVPTDGSLRADILRLVLEDDRERYRMDREHETNTQRTGILRELKDTVKDHIGDGIDAVRDWAQRDRENGASGEGDGGEAAAEGEKPRRWRVFCPNEGCGKANMFDEPPGQEMTCGWCGRRMQVAV